MRKRDSKRKLREAEGGEAKGSENAAKGNLKAADSVKDAEAGLGMRKRDSKRKLREESPPRSATGSASVNIGPGRPRGPGFSRPPGPSTLRTMSQSITRSRVLPSRPARSSMWPRLSPAAWAAFTEP